MKITVISASTRDEAQSRNVSDYLVGRLRDLGVESEVVDLSEKLLPLFDATGVGEWKEMWGEMSGVFEKSEGFVFVSPEWDGMFSAGLHNMFHYLDKEMADKPVVLVGVSSGRGGRYPLLQMRMMGYKNKGFVILPQSIYYDNVGENLVDGKLTDERNVERTDYILRVLLEYAKGLGAVRASGVIDNERFANGL